MHLRETVQNLTIDDLKALSQRRLRKPVARADHAFWAGAMPDPNVRPNYHEAICKLYEFLDPPLQYVDAYDTLMGGAPVFNEVIQEILIQNAAYMVIDLSVPRHDSLFEAGFGFGSGIETFLYFDIMSSMRHLEQYKREKEQFTNFNEFKKLMPPQVQDTIFALPPREIPEWSIGSKAIYQQLASWFNNLMHTKSCETEKIRLDCCKINFEKRPCEFIRELNKINQMNTKHYYFTKFQSDHEDQEKFARDRLARIGLHPVDILADTVKHEPPLCQTCFFLRLADSIIIDGTSASSYLRDAAECAFTLGMAVGLLSRRLGMQKRKGVSKGLARPVRIKMLYEEKIGPIGMFAGLRSGWEVARWRDQIAMELENW